MIMIKFIIIIIMAITSFIIMVYYLDLHYWQPCGHHYDHHHDHHLYYHQLK